MSKQLSAHSTRNIWLALHPPIAVVKDLGALDQRLKKFGAARRRGRNDKSDLILPPKFRILHGRHEEFSEPLEPFGSLTR
jgi:hypothetical protein